MSAQVQKISPHPSALNGAGNSLFIAGHAVGIAVPGGASPQSVAVSWSGGLPAGYQVSVAPSMKAMCWVTSKTATRLHRELGQRRHGCCRYDRRLGRQRLSGVSSLSLLHEVNR
jgi:hypothetical protein